MATVIKGGCLCGAVRYECKADPIMAGHCQYRDCQKDSGTGHASMMMFPKAAIKITGTAKEHQRKADSGNTVTRGFCANCGSPIYWRTTGMSDGMWIHVGSLDAPGAFGPQFVVWTASGRAWDHLDPALPKFERSPHIAS
jgi:hypothetical protein